MLIAYSSRGKDGNKITVVSVGDWNVRKTLSLADNQSDLVRIAWAPDNKTLYYVTEKAWRNSLWQQSLDDQPPVLIGDTGSEEVGEFAVSPDGKSLGFIRGKWIHDAVLIEGLK
jgi:Tol biopolymer transport system component